MKTMPLAIDPIALSLGPVNVTWYGLILGLGAVAGLLLAVREGKRFQIAPEFFMDLLLIGVPAAIIGARTYYVAFEWDKYKGNWYEIIAIWHGGLAIHGALIGAVLAGLIYTRVKKVSFWRIADIAAPSLIAGQMIGRWGNFVNQEAHGGPVDRAFLSDQLHLPDWIVNQMQIGDAFYHPTFLYESFWNLAVLILLLVLRRRPWLRAGELFLGYFALYSVGRFFIEGLRTDSLAFHGPAWLEHLLKVLWMPMRLVFEAGALPPGGGNVRMAQLISLLLIVAAVILILWRRFGGYARERYLDPVVFGSPSPTDGGAGGTGGSNGETGGGAGGSAGGSGAGEPAEGEGETGSGDIRVHHMDNTERNSDMRNEEKDKESKGKRLSWFGMGRKSARAESASAAEPSGQNKGGQDGGPDKAGKDGDAAVGRPVANPLGVFGSTDPSGRADGEPIANPFGLFGPADPSGSTGKSGASDASATAQGRDGDRHTVQGGQGMEHGDERDNMQSGTTSDPPGIDGLPRRRYEPGNPFL